MKLNQRLLLAVLTIVCTTFGCLAQKTNVLSLGFALPKAAKYTVTAQQFEDATNLLRENFLADTNQLGKIISHPCMCGPGLWHLLKDSPYFSTPPRARTICKVPLANGKFQEFPAALIQDDIEAANFRAALVTLLSRNGVLKFRLPSEQEFKTYWATIPFDDINDALVVAEGADFNLLISFSKGKPFWFEEVKQFRSRL